MSSSNVSFNTKEKKPGHVAADILSRLQEYKEQELSVKSKCLRDKLLETANKVLNDNDPADVDFLEIAFEAFEEKQKREKTMSDKIESLEAQLQDATAQNQQLMAARDDLELLFKFGDWFSILICEVKQVEGSVKEDEEKILAAEYKQENQTNKAQAVAAGKAWAKANKVPYTGQYDFTPIPHGQAEKDTKWPALMGRYASECDERVVVERNKIAEWRAGGAEEATAPATPFLDRLQGIADKVGMLRSDLLLWTKQYGKRNTICHAKPPEVGDFKKIIQQEDGTAIEVTLDQKNPEDGIDWPRFRDAFDPFRADITARHAAGKIGLAEHDAYLRAIDAYWALFSVSDDDKGEPVITKFAVTKARGAYSDQQTISEPAENPKQRYWVGKWNDI